MDKILALIVSKLLTNTAISSKVYDRIYPAHIGTLNAVTFPLITVYENVSGDSILNGKLYKTILIIACWSSRNFAECMSLGELSKIAIDAAHPIYNQHGQVTMTTAGIPTTDSFPESYNTPRSYCSTQRYLSGIAIR